MAHRDSPSQSPAESPVRIIRSPATDLDEQPPTSGEIGRRGRWIAYLAFIGAVLILALGDTRSPTSSSATLPSSVPPSGLENAWASSTPEEQGIDSGSLADLVERAIASGWIDSVTVVRNGTVVLDTVLSPFPEEVGHELGPSTASVLGALVGIAIDRGLLPGVDAPVVEILAGNAPEIPEDLSASVTVEHLLTMSSGLECGGIDHDDPYSTLLGASRGGAVNALDLPGATEPGARFEYCERSVSLLSSVLSEVTDKPVADFAAEALFEPLGITDFTWPAGRRGTSSEGGGLVLLPADMAKIGHLHLRAGVWDGEQVISPEWIEIATAPHIETFDSVSSQYGYGWYVYSGFVMSNRGDQSIVIVPALDLVAVFTSGLPPTRNYMPEELTTQYLLAAIRPDPPAADPTAQERLASVVAAARAGPEPVSVEAPEMAAVVDGVRYEFRSNDHGHEWLRLRSSDDTATLEYQGGLNSPAGLFAREGAAGPIEVDVGLQGRFLVDESCQPQSAWRGEWEDEDTLLIEYRIIGKAHRGLFRLTFGESTVRLQLRDTTAGTVHDAIADRAEL